MFGNYTKKNEKSRQELVKLTRGIKTMKGAAALGDELDKIERLLSNDVPNASKQTVKLDDEITRMFARIKSDIKNGYVDLALSECREVAEKASSRNGLASADDDLFSNETKLDSEFKKLQKRKDEITAELDRLDAQYKRNPDDDYLESRIEKYEDELDAVESDIDKYMSALSVLNINKQNEQKVSTGKRISGLMPDKEEVAVNQQKAAEADELGKQMADQANELRGYRSGERARRRAEREARRGRARGEQIGEQIEEKSGSQDTIDAIYSESEKMLEDIAKVNDECEDKIAEVKSESDEEAAILVDLLTKRKTLTAAECVVIDSDIRHHKARFISCKSRIEVLAQARAYNDELLVAVNAARDQKDVKQIKALVDKNSAFLKDPEKAALAIKASKQANNEELEHMSTVNAVIGSAETDDGVLSSGRVSDAELTGAVKNDDEFADLEQMLGMRKE